jgi:NADH:ubiquinone oxidoreductase subunit 4 (subunit M)
VKKYIAAVVSIIVFLAILIPFASSNPDGLEKVAETMGIEEHEPVWKGLMSDYSVEIAGTPYVSTLLAGVFGTLIVLMSTFIFGKAIASKKPHANSDETPAHSSEC